MLHLTILNKLSKKVAAFTQQYFLNFRNNPNLMKIYYFYIFFYIEMNGFLLLLYISINMYVYIPGIYNRTEKWIWRGEKDIYIRSIMKFWRKLFRNNFYLFNFSIKIDCLDNVPFMVLLKKFIFQNVDFNKKTKIN